MRARGDVYAIVDTCFKFRALFIIVPGHQLDSEHLRFFRIIFSGFSDACQPCAAALLVNESVLAPQSNRVVKAFVTGTERQIISVVCGCIIVSVQITDIRYVWPGIVPFPFMLLIISSGSRLNPGVTAI